MPAKLKYHLPAIGCALFPILCYLLVHPYVEMGVDDDWSYVRSAMLLAQTGHLTYVGWGTAIVGWQLYLGALSIKIFGFSFSVVRLSVLPVAAVTIYLFHRVLARCGVSQRNATAGALVLAFSPLFVPLACSFMSDVTGLFSILLCLYLCLRSLQAATREAAVHWLIWALVSNVVTGTVRQTSWLGAIVMVPCTFWLLRKWSFSWGKAALVWLGGMSCILGSMEWFLHQPFTQKDHPMGYILHHYPLNNIAGQVVRFVFFTGLTLLPVLVAFPAPAWTKGSRSRWTMCLTFVALVLLTLGLSAHSRSQGDSLLNWCAPWGRNTVTENGVFDFPEIGPRPPVIDGPIRVLVSVAVLAGIAGFVAILNGSRQPVQRREQAATPIPSGGQILFLLGPFAIVYCLLLLPRAAVNQIFERYALPLLAVGLIAALRMYETRVRASRLPIVSLACGLLFAIFAVAATHDFYSMERARLQAIDEILAGGVPRTAFYGGFDYDSWTETSIAGYLTSPNTNLPPGAKQRDLKNLPVSCRAWYGGMTPSIDAKFAVSFDADACDHPSRFAPVEYHTWLPPYSAAMTIGAIAPGATEPAGGVRQESPRFE